MSNKLKLIELPSEAVYKEIESVGWFSRVFTCANESLIQVKSIEEVNSIYESTEFENQLYDRQADLSEFLCLNFRNEYQDWNSIVHHTKIRLSDCFDLIDIEATRIGFNKAVVDKVRWDIVAYVQEQAYKRYKEPGYYSKIFHFYKIGRVPCGVVGVYPKGEFRFA